MTLPANEPVRDYRPGSRERATLKAALADLAGKEIEVTPRIGGKAQTTGALNEIHAPHAKRQVLGRYHSAGARETEAAIEAALAAHHDWSRTPFEERAAIFLKCADLLAGPHRDRLNAATMLGQSKTCFQAEIDAACELIDFFRFNVHYARALGQVSLHSPTPTRNQMWLRPLEGFVFAATPFNFTSIAANLCLAPALMGNTVVWKPSERAVYAAHFIMDLFDAAGLPPGVINMVPAADPGPVGEAVFAHRDFAGLHFTGSTGAFYGMWQKVGDNIRSYRNFPRLVGETGGKDFIFAHQSADVPALVTALIRGAFEYQGQKCSAASRAFIPAGLWDAVVEGLEAGIAQIKMGPPEDFANFMGAVIDARAYAAIKGAIDHARTGRDHKLLVGGGCDDSEGYFIAPTVVVAEAPDAKLMREEIFGPVLTLYRYEESALEATLAAADAATPYALTGAVFAEDRAAIARIADALRYAAGNFYINDKPTGAVVGQQPFGGGRASGTNDKAGSALNLLRWTSPQTVKENFVPPRHFAYPHMAAED
ncbi:MAG: L-glutamate gamma-semialdehyde dehydrogenase [Pseudomonadota bacterium]